MARTPNPYPSLDEPQYDAVVNGRYRQISLQQRQRWLPVVHRGRRPDRLPGRQAPPAERKARTLIFTQHELAAFIAGAKNGDFDHLLD